MELDERFRRDGLVSPVTVVSASDAADHRARLEAAEAEMGSLHYADKIHTMLTSPFELATHPTVLAAVEQFIGPDILLYNATYIIKEPGTTSHVAWHQDLTYWGLADDDAQVSMWLALAPADERSGCMQMIPGSHRRGRVEHAHVTDDDNVLLLGQRIDGLDTTGAIYCPLRPGEASFHHGWTLHASPPNISDDRRIGLNVQYLAPHNRHLHSDHASAILVAGVDEYGYFGTDVPANRDLDAQAIERWRELDRRMKSNFTTG